MLIINNVKLPLDYDFSDLTYAAAKALKTNRKNIKSASLFRKSVDARHKNDVHFCCLFSPKMTKGLKKTARNYIVTQSTYGKKQAIPICALWLRGSALRECLPL